jgi:ubiquinone/menaquinone biosynthesis C-methylase UbiE
MRLNRSVAVLAASLFAVSVSHAVAGQLASRPAEEWNKTLDAPKRAAELRIDEIIPKIGLKPGQIVADLGAGPGLFVVPLAKGVSPGGMVYAVEIDEGFFESINRKAAEQQVTNVRTVLGKFTDPNLPTKAIDLAFFHDVLHHVEDRAGYLKALAGYIKPTGRIVVIDYEAGQGGHRNDPKMQVTREQLSAWMADAGFKQTEDIKLFTDKYFVVYSRR